MSTQETSPFIRISDYAELIRSRESTLGAYVGDGPTAENLDELMATLAPIKDFHDSVECAVIWDAFRVSLETEMTWLFPERDPISGPMIQALQEVQRLTGHALEAADAEWKLRLEQLANLQIIKHAALRQSKLRGNKISIGLVAARFLNKIGAKRTAESLADSVVRRWQN